MFVAIDLQDWVALSKIEHDWQSSSRLSLFELRFVPKGPNLASIIEKKEMMLVFDKVTNNTGNFQWFFGGKNSQWNTGLKPSYFSVL